ARWSRELKMRPHEGNQVISLLGDAVASYTTQGELQAEEIHLWLFEIAPSKTAAPEENSARSRIRPIQMLAEGPSGVRIESPQLSGAVGRLETYFRQIADNSTAPERRDAQTPPGAQRREPRERLNGTTGSTSLASAGRRSSSNPGRQHYE